MSSKAGSIGDLISVPKGGGALKGVGEKFSADLHTGTGNFSVPLAIPPGRNGFQPQLSLGFSTGSGNGAFGMGWSLNVPGVSRLASKGIPRYRDAGQDEERDIFVLSGSEDLVDLGTANGVTRYRPRTEGLFALISRHLEGDTDHWEVRTKDGLVSHYGTPHLSSDDPAVVYDPANPRKVFSWRLTDTTDPFGNRIAYEYRRDLASGGQRSWDQLYLKRIAYADLNEVGQAPFLFSVEFLYDDQPSPPGTVPTVPALARLDPFSDYRAGFEIRTCRRCKWIVVRTHPAHEKTILVRAYELIYLDETEAASDPAVLPANGASLLSQIHVIGYDDAGAPHRDLPPLEFAYSRFTPETRKFFPLKGSALPATSLANPDLELVDLFGNGLPDILELGSAVRYWRNLGEGRFDVPRSIPEVPAGLRLSDSGVQMLDANGDGRADLLVTNGAMSGYFPLDFRARFSKKSFQRYQQAPSFNLENPEVRLVDLTGDGVTDVLRSGTSFECYFNDPKRGWLPENTRRVQRKSLDAFPDVDFSDARVKFADMSGDGLQDIALVHEGRIDYWPNLGYGRWGARITMTIPERLPFNFDPRRVLLGDVDGDGLADLIYVSDREIKLWVNHTGNGWSDPKVIRGTPALMDIDTVRIVDLLGNGVGGILWTRDADGSGRPHHFFLDLTGGTKPYLLNRMQNNLGAATEVTYSTSTRFYVNDYASSDTRWKTRKTTLPFPVQVVERVVVSDVFSGGSLTTEYRYHHGYWDGSEREFRGFGMVEQLDTEVFDGYAGRGLSGNDAALQRLLAKESFSPPLLTRTWFHQGLVEPDHDGHGQEVDWSSEYWGGDPNVLNLLKQAQSVNVFLRGLAADVQRDALRTLRGSIVRSELYALDGSPLQEDPYTVTEHAYQLREEEKPAEGSLRKHIFFPHGFAQRTTQWERGADPMTRFAFAGDYDPFGQPRRQVTIACPRGWQKLSDTPAAGYLATLGITTFATTMPDGVYIRDRVARTRSYEILETGGLEQVLDATEASNRLFAETLNFYDGKAAQSDYGAFAGLPFGEIGQFGALVRSDSLMLTEDILTSAYDLHTPPYLDPETPFDSSAEYPAAFVTSLPALAGYVLQPVDTGSPYSCGYFAITSSKRFDFHNAQGAGRGLVLAQRDPLGHESTIAYDQYGLLPVSVTMPASVTNAVELMTTAEYNYRVLQPNRVTEPNGNVSKVAYTPTGLVKATWVRGNPRKNEGAKNEPSIRMEYGLRTFYDSVQADSNSPQPVFARAIRRVFDDSDPDDTGETIEAREYSDGFGRLLQARTQGESVRFGDDTFGGGDDVLPLDQSSAGPATVTGKENNDPNAPPNVVVSGWQRYDNKGRVIEKFEPFFATGWTYLPPTATQNGEKVTMFYDPRGQVIRTVNPDASEQRVIYGIPKDLADPPLSALDTAKFDPTPWEAYSYDANDNAGRTHASDPVAVTYRHHWNTPTNIEIDALGRTIRAVARNRDAPDPGTSTLPPIQEHVTRSSYDIQGNIVAIRDPLGRKAFEYTFDLAKHPLRTLSVDAGARLAVVDAAGNLVERRDVPMEGRDAKGAIALHAYDALNRLTCLWARDDANAPMTVREILVYGDVPNVTDPVEHNLLGKLYRHFDEAGVVTIADYDFKGNVLESSRQVLSDEFMLSDIQAQSGSDWVLSAPRVDWPPWPAALPAGLLDPTLYTSHSTFDALNRVKRSEFPQCANGERYRLLPSYNHAGALERVELEGPLDPNSNQAPHQTYVTRLAYSAKGQRTLIAYGNGILTRYAYDPQTFRLGRMRTERFDPVGSAGYQRKGAPLQDIAYGYDLAGNILGMQDITPGCGVAGAIVKFGVRELIRRRPCWVDISG